MSKLSLLLHDTTILNFVKVYGLTKRYYYLLLIIPLVAVATYFYLSSKNAKVYFQSSLISLKSKTSAVTGLESKLFQESFNSPMMEFKSDVSTWKFKTLLSEHVLRFNDFPKFVLSSTASSTLMTGADLANFCKQERDCMLEQLNFLLAGLYKIKESELNAKGILEVHTLDEVTTYKLRVAVEQSLVEHRLQGLVSTYQKQRETLQQIVDSKKHNIFKNNSDERWKLKDRELKLQELTTTLSKEESEIGKLKGELSRIDLDNPSDNFSGGALNEAQIRKINILKDEIDGISKNIAQLQISDKLSEIDKTILQKLTRQHRLKEKELKALGGVQENGKIMERVEREKVGHRRDYFLKKIREKEETIAQLLSERQDIVQQITVLSEQDRLQKVSYDYIQSLEKRLIEIKLAEATVEPDVAIDSTDPSVQVIFRMRRSLVIGFSLGLGCMLWFVTLIFCYLIDQRLFSDDEILLGIGSDLEIIGETPNLS